MRRLLYSSLRLVSRYGYLIRRRFTRAGLLVLTALVATGTVGVDTSQTVAYQLFSFLFFLVLVAMVQSWLFRPAIRIERRLPPCATVGEPFRYGIVVENLSGAVQTGLGVLENMVDPRPSYDEFTRALRRKHRARNWLRRLSIWDRWQTMIAGRQPASLPEQDLPALAAGQVLEISPEVTPHHRGSIELTGLTLTRADRFGLFKAFRPLALPGSVLVLPRRYALAPLALPGNRMYQPGGMTLGASVGDSEEFIGLREYRPGDPLKRIHWKSFARTGKPVVKEYQDEYFERHALLLDTFSAHGADAVFEEAISIAASFVTAIDTQECLLDLLFVGGQTYCFTAGRGQLHARNMLEILAHARPSEDRPFSDLHDSVLERRPLLSGCIAVLLGWDGPRRRLIQALAGTGLALLTLVVDEAPPPEPSVPGVHFLTPGNIAQELATL